MPHDDPFARVIPPAVQVGVTHEAEEDDPMPAAELRCVREWLGLTVDQLAQMLEVEERSVRRWEHGARDIPDGIRESVEALEQVAAGIVGVLVARLQDATEITLTIPASDTEGGFPAAWWRRIAMRVASEVYGLTIRYADEPGGDEA